MALLSWAEEQVELSAFLKNFPTPLHYIQPESYNKPWVFWSQDEESGSQINSSSSAGVHPPMLHDHIKSAFAKLKYISEWLIVQLWAPVTIGGRRLLSTSAQPFALRKISDNNLKKYRLRCMEYQYNIHVNNQQLHIQKQQPPQNQGYPMILSGGPAAAFLNRMPEFAHLKDHQGSPLARYALEECQLETCIMLPICSPSQTSSSCIAVVECIFYNPYQFWITNRMKSLLESLQEAGLSICPVQERIPYKTFNGLKHARNDIETALKIVCESHNLLLAQVWIAYEDENHDPFSSSVVDMQTKHMIALKLTGYFDKAYDHTDAMSYYDTCDVVHLETGEELVWKTLQDYEPRFYIDTHQLTTNKLISFSTCFSSKTSYLVVCLRSTETGDLDYAFEFMWFHTRKFVTLLKALLLTLKSCLPNFKFASGAELGDELELRVIKRFSEIKSLKIFRGKKSSQIPYEVKWKTAPKQLSQEDIEKQFGITMIEAANNLKVSLSTLKRKCKEHHIYEWQGRPNVMKRKVNASSNNQSNRNEEDNGAIQEPSVVNIMENILTIKAEYAGDTIKFDLHISEATFVNVEKEIGMNFNLTLGAYKLNYLDEDGDWILLASDQHMEYCIKRLRNVDQTSVRLRVLPSPHKPSSD